MCAKWPSFISSMVVWMITILDGVQGKQHNDHPTANRQNRTRSSMPAYVKFTWINLLTGCERVNRLS
ncbi:hypothetical protein RP20_CCG004232 [Aedes albopictus]|nr:hypothetical protein RP20_CCG004232 [Aedes albopictus]